MLLVTFEFLSGFHQAPFANVRLKGSWNATGHWDSEWSATPMESFTAEDGCPAWRVSVPFDGAQHGVQFRWGIIADCHDRTDVWLIAGVGEDGKPERAFTLSADSQIERAWFSHARRLGANKHWRPGQVEPSIQFSVWVPNALNVTLAVGDPVSGYIWDNGRGVIRRHEMVPGSDGVWHTRADDNAFACFAEWDHIPYMFQVVRNDGSVAYRTDLYSRCQIGSGKADPAQAGTSWDGRRQTLDGMKSCSVVIDPETVTAGFDPGEAWPPSQWLSAAEFWKDEFDHRHPLPGRIEDLVIYELHVGGLGKGDGPGTLADAIALLDYLVDLGINAVELLPMTEFEGWASWGYGTSHYFAVEFVSGGRDQFKYFVRECHRRGIGVILDVVYNHYSPVDADRAEWLYDSPWHDRNVYYWYEGTPFYYPGDSPCGHGGYLDNGSSGYSPNFKAEMVRKMFISSAVALLTEFHIDGFRMDLTDAIHRNPKLHYNGCKIEAACLWGGRFLSEWCRTLRLVRPSVMLIAEDHTGWDAMHRPLDQSGIGFDRVWYADWYHHLIGDATDDRSKSRLLHVAACYGDEAPLAMDYLAGALTATPSKVVYHESHDEAGNSEYAKVYHSARTLIVAGGYSDDPSIRAIAEARTRVVAGLTILSPGTPMFLMGEEVGATKPYRYNDFLLNREDFVALRADAGARLFSYYQDLIALRRRASPLCSPQVQVVHVHTGNRILSFRRWDHASEYLVVASLNAQSFLHGYVLDHPSLVAGRWQECLNSDDPRYGGKGTLNPAPISSTSGHFQSNLPANGIAVFKRL